MPAKRAPKAAKAEPESAPADSGREEWARMVDAVAATAAGPLTDDDRERCDATPAELPASVAAYLKGSEDAVAGLARPFAPQLTFTEGMHARPAKAHETDVFTAGRGGGAVDGPDFATLVRDATRHVRQKNVEIMEARKQGAGQLGGMLLQASWHKAVDFAPIIIVPAATSAAVQLGNVQRFLEEGVYTPAHTAWLDAAGNPAVGGQDKEVVVRPSPALFPGIADFETKFRMFRVVDDPRSIPASEWHRVCACFAGPGEWQFDAWYGGDEAKRQPANIFSEVRGFFPYFADERVPDEVRQWRVHPLVFSRNAIREHAGVIIATTVWEQLFRFLDAHPNFRQYTIATETPDLM